jgi:hypothetical protein
MSKTASITVLALLVVASASAQMPADIAVYPVVAHTAGLNNTEWVTDVTIFNPMDYEISVGVQFHVADRANYLQTFHRHTEVIGPGCTVTFEDILPSLYGIDGDMKGWLALVAKPGWLPNPLGTVFHSAVRIYNTGGTDGTYGQSLSPFVGEINVGWSSSFITGVRNDDSYRSNLGIATISLGVTVYYRIFSSDNAVIAEGSKDVPQYSMSQWSLDDLGVESVDGPVSVELWMDPSDASPDPCDTLYPQGFAAYVSKVDNRTGDGEFLTAYPMDPFICEMYE